ncbi:MAG: SDR family oxidoreductase [Bdellovibrionales bacterium]|nr:SDR family oxidoreductase [Bdellovibrionales bacterium]
MTDSFTLLTGASSGIGFELAKIFAAKNHNLILTARSKETLEKLAEDLRNTHKVKVEVVALDLGLDSSPETLFNYCQEHGLNVDILVNNAGFGDNVVFARSEWRKQAQMMDLNMKSLTHLCHLFIPEMIANREGAILNVASTAAFQPGPFMAVYYATKSYVLSFSEALNEELRGTGVHVTTLCPGPTISGFQEAAGMDTTLLFKMPIPNSRIVAEYGYQSLMAKKSVAVQGWANKLMAFSVRLSPRGLLVRVVRLLQEKRMGAS